VRLTQQFSAITFAGNIRAGALLKRIGQWVFSIPRVARSLIGPAVRSYCAPLPEGYPARRIRVDLSIPPLPRRSKFEFTEHAVDASGAPTDRVLAASVGAFAVSEDLGRSWHRIEVRAFSGAKLIHIKSLDNEEFLVQSADASTSAKAQLIDLSVVNVKGEVLAHFPKFSMRWHGCRSVGHAGGTLMFAEYPQNRDRKWSSRVFRSRDCGRSWDVIFRQTGEEIRHFHFLQPRPAAPGEWWLSSGDHPHECRIWVSKDDGDTWIDLTASAPGRMPIGGQMFRRDVFRLTDLMWEKGAIIWATDDALQQVRNGTPGARVFRSPIGDDLRPQEIGRGNWHFRSLVDIGPCYLFLSQGNPDGGLSRDDRPGVYLVPKESVPGVTNVAHLFDIQSLTPLSTNFTASRASRAAKDGVFFTLRGRADIFLPGHRILKWQVTFE
jgi:hypothetical protein